jgi:hypothetical protein
LSAYLNFEFKDTTLLRKKISKRINTYINTRRGKEKEEELS